MEIKKADVGDLEDVLAIIQSAKDSLKKKDTLRWPDNYSPRSEVLDRISRGQQFMVTENKKLAGSFVLEQDFPEGVFGTGKKDQDLLPLSIEKVAVVPKKDYIKVVKAVLDFAQKHAKKTDSNRIFFSDYLGCEPCEEALLQKGYHKSQEIKQDIRPKEGMVCFEKEV